MGLNSYIGIRDGIIVIIVLFYNPLDMLPSDDSCEEEEEFGAERWGRVTAS